MQTRIEHLRGLIEDSQTINHHGKALEVSDGKVVGVSEVGESLADSSTPVESFHK